METMQKMKVYIGTKIIMANPMSKHTFARDRGREENGNDEEGYIVVYADGYVSWSPKAVFEQAYREVSKEEANLLI